MNFGDLTLTEIWNLNTKQAIAILEDLNIKIHSGATVTELRALIATRKKQLLDAKPSNTESESEHTSPGESTNSYENQGVQEQGDELYEEFDNFTDTTRSSTPISHIYEDIDMAEQPEKIPYFNPGLFSGNPGESVDHFLLRMDRAAIVNRWTDERKKLYLPMYLTGTAAIVFDNLEAKYPNITWEEIKDEFKKNFSPVENKELLLAKLNTRVQLPTETVIQYMADVERLCTLTDRNMDESRVCNHILKGLNPGTLQLVSLMDNSTLLKMKNNIGKFEMSSYLLKQRLGLELPSSTEVVQKTEPNIGSRIDSMEQAMRQLQISLINHGEGQRNSSSRGHGGDRMREDMERRHEFYGDGNFRNDYTSREDYHRREHQLQPTTRSRGDFRMWQDTRDERRRDYNLGDQRRVRFGGSRERSQERQRGWNNFRNKSRERTFDEYRNYNNRGSEKRDMRKDGCFKCGSLEHFARGCRKNMQKN